MQKHPCFIALTRPVMRFGVTTTFLGLNLFGGFFIMVLAKAYLTAFIALLFFHGIGMVVLSVDPRFVEIIFGKIRCCRLDNWIFWGCTSYEAY